MQIWYVHKRLTESYKLRKLFTPWICWCYEIDSWHDPAIWICVMCNRGTLCCKCSCVNEIFLAYKRWFIYCQCHWRLFVVTWNQDKRKYIAINYLWERNEHKRGWSLMSFEVNKNRFCLKPKSVFVCLLQKVKASKRQADRWKEERGRERERN